MATYSRYGQEKKNDMLQLTGHDQIVPCAQGMDRYFDMQQDMARYGEIRKIWPDIAICNRILLDLDVARYGQIRKIWVDMLICTYLAISDRPQDPCFEDILSIDL